MKIGGQTYHAADVLAGAYRGKDVEARPQLVHTVLVGETGRIRRALCGYRKLDHLITDADDVEREPTCARCAARLAKLRAKSPLGRLLLREAVTSFCDTYFGPGDVNEDERAAKRLQDVLLATERGETDDELERDRARLREALQRIRTLTAIPRDGDAEARHIAMAQRLGRIDAVAEIALATK